MKSLFLVLAMLFSVVSIADNEPGSDEVVAWLEVVDQGDYIESWNQAAPFFQQQISSSKWAQALKQVRTPLGKVLSRKITSTSSHSSLPGVPDGDYMVVILAASLEFKKSATETVTVEKIDQAWRVIGYFIR